MTKRYATCQTVGELREALSGISDDVALFGDEQEDRYVSITVDLDNMATRQSDVPHAREHPQFALLSGIEHH
jgi:hypothetical protein